MKFLIFAPPYRNSSAGIRVLHRLSKELIQRGHGSFVFSDWAHAAQLTAHLGNAIVVYPEIIRGNPVGAANVVRYVLNTPGYMGCDSTYADNELVFAYNKTLIPAAQSATKSQVVDDSRIMEISVLEPWLFQPDATVEKKFDVVFWAGKGLQLAHERTDAIQDLIRGKRFAQIAYENPSTREGLARLFQSSHEFLTTDDFTAMIPEAKLCGCKVTIMREHGPEEFKGDVSDWITKWQDTACIDNFVRVCQQRFQPLAAAA